MSGRWPTSSRVATASKVPRKGLSLDFKLQVLRQLEAGDIQVDVADAFKLATSMVRTIIKNADMIKASAMTNMKLTARKVICSSSSFLENMDGGLSEARLCEKHLSTQLVRITIPLYLTSLIVLTYLLSYFTS